MKKIFNFISIVCLVVVFAFALSACSPAAVQQVVTLPDPLRLGIESAVVFAVGWVFVQIGMRWPWFVKTFGQYADEVAFAVTGGLLATIQSWLDLIPPQWETPANLFLAFVVAVFVALQAFRLLGKAGVKSFRE